MLGVVWCEPVLKCSTRRQLRGITCAKVLDMCAQGLTGPDDDDTRWRFAKAVKNRATRRAVIGHGHCRMTDEISLTCRAPASSGGAGACLR
jgi:hypothetical protein